MTIIIPYMLQREVGSVSLVLKEPCVLVPQDGCQYRGPPEEHQECRPQLHRCSGEWRMGEELNLTDIDTSILQVKVREATSNDPWGPSSTQMSEIADLTYNMVAFSEIMQMIWKRLNDHGKNWRHVYKALVLLEYLIKTGSEKVETAWHLYILAEV